MLDDFRLNGHSYNSTAIANILSLQARTAEIAYQHRPWRHIMSLSALRTIQLSNVIFITQMLYKDLY